MQKKQLFRRVGMIAVLGLVSVSIALPSSIWGEGYLGSKLSSFKVTLGLDLAGGTELDYRIDLSDGIAKNSDDDELNNVDLEQISESVRDALERRVNPGGVGEITVRRSQVDAEEHVLIQMPPSSNVAKTKQEAERDNRLEFFEEVPDEEKKARRKIEGELVTTNGLNWDKRVAELTQGEGVTHEVFEPRFKDEFSDPNLWDVLAATTQGYVLEELADTQTELVYNVSADGELRVTKTPESVLAIVKLTHNGEEAREKKSPPMAKARHILFGYKGALRASENAYIDADEARTAAEDTLAQLKEEGTDNFSDLAKELSTEGAAQESGGDLGEFGPGQMVPSFNDAVFNAEGPGLLAEIVESDFGFHVIDVLDLQEEKTESTSEMKIGYEMIAWNKKNLRWKKTELGGPQLDQAGVGWDQVGKPFVTLHFSPEGGKMFADITGRVSARRCDDDVCRLAIYVGSEMLSEPRVERKIVGRDAQITGNFTPEDAKGLARGLNLGAIDAPVILSGQMTIRPELGADQLSRSLKAATFGILGIMIFMIAVYRLAGVVATVSLSLYASFFITILKIWPESFYGPIVLSLAGAAGIALSIGLAVDGNILIFERFKEEIRRGRGLSKAVDLGFDRAWPAIWDSNVTTFLTCMILFIFGNALMRGFAITLMVGTALSLFTAITISYTLLRFILIFEKFKNPAFFGVGFGDSKESSVGAKIRERK